MILIRYALKRLLKKNARLFLGLVLISSMGIAVLTAMLNSYEGVRNTFDSYFEEYHFPDVTFLAAGLFGQEAVRQTEAMEGIASAQPRLCVDGELAVEGKSGISVRCYSADEDDAVRYYVLDELQEIPKDSVPMSLEACFAELAGFHLGDEFDLHINGNTSRCVLARIVSSPECAVVYRDKRFHYSTDEFGYAFFAYEELKTMCGQKEAAYNQLLIETAPGASHAGTGKIVKDSGVLPPGSSFYTYEESVQKEFVDSCTEPLEVISYFLSIVFFLISMVMIYLFMYQLVMEEKKTIGTYMSLGISPWQIAMLYHALGGCIAVCSVLIGNMAGYLFMGMVNDLYKNSFYLPYVENIWSVRIMVQAAIVNTIIIQAAILLAELPVFKLEAIEAVREKPSGKVPPLGLRCISFMGCVEKVCFSSAFRNKRRLMLSYVSTILTVAMIVFSFQYLESGRYITEHTFTERYQYDAQLAFKEGLQEKQADALMDQVEGIASYEYFTDYDAVLQAGEKSVETTIYGIEESSKLIRMGKKGTGFRLKENEILLPSQMAKELEVSPGDSITVKEIRLTVAGVYDECMFFVPYCSLDTLEKITGERISGAYLTYSEDGNRKTVCDSLHGQEGFGYLSEKDSQKEGTVNRLSKMEIAVYLILAMSFIVGFVIIFNMALINLKERKRSFSIMMAMGMDVGEIGRAALLELACQYVLALCAGEALGRTLGRYLLYASSTDLIQYQQTFSFTGLGLTMASVGAFMLLGHMFAQRKLKRLDMADELRTKEE